MTVHRCPPIGSGIMPCCGRTPFEVMQDRMTLRDDLVTCGIDDWHQADLSETDLQTGETRWLIRNGARA